MMHNWEVGSPYFFSDDKYFSLSWVLHNPGVLWKGVPFSATLLAVLMAHEMGHFILALRNRVYATLPFFIPAPTPLGTLGAFIQIKSLFPSRKALFDVGIAGPIAGFVVALPAAMLGLFLSKPIPSAVPIELYQFGFPLIFHALYLVMDIFGKPPALNMLALHPIAIAAWIGMFATMLNLIPGGQLDGGHLIYALSPRAHKAVTYAVMVVLLCLAFFCYMGWGVWAIFVYLSRKHPYVPEWPNLETGRRYMFVLAAIMLVVTLIPAPFPGMALWDFFKPFFAH
jgi:membrane-associated protease RseP (regulator of RpoE activity)